MLEELKTILTILAIVIPIEMVFYRIIIRTVIDYKDKMYFYRDSWNIYVPLFRAMRVDPIFTKTPVTTWALFTLVFVVFLPIAVLYTLFYPLLRAIFYAKLYKTFKEKCNEELPTTNEVTSEDTDKKQADDSKVITETTDIVVVEDTNDIISEEITEEIDLKEISETFKDTATSEEILEEDIEDFDIISDFEDDITVADLTDNDIVVTTSNSSRSDIVSQFESIIIPEVQVEDAPLHPQQEDKEDRVSPVIMKEESTKSKPITSTTSSTTAKKKSTKSTTTTTSSKSGPKTNTNGGGSKSNSNSGKKKVSQSTSSSSTPKKKTTSSSKNSGSTTTAKKSTTIKNDESENK